MPSALAAPTPAETPAAGDAPPAPAQSIEEVLYAVAFYGDPNHAERLAALAPRLSAENPAWPAYLIALARCGGANARQQVRAAAASHPIPAAICLGMIGDDACRKDPSEVVAGWSAEQVTGAVAAWPAIAGDRARRVFIETCVASCPAATEQESALKALAGLDEAVLEQALATRFLAAEPAPETAAATEAKPAEAAAFAGPVEEPPATWRFLAERRNTAAVKRLVQLLDSPDPARKRRAVGALACCRDASLLDVFSALLADATPGVARCAADALARIPDQRVVMMLAYAINADRLTPAVLDALGGAQKEAPFVLEALCHIAETASAPGAAPLSGVTPVMLAEAIVRVGGDAPAANKALASLSADADVRRILLARKWAETKRMTPEFPGLSDAAPANRAACLRWLTGAPAADAGPILLNAMKDADASVRQAAIKVAATITGPDAPAHAADILRAGLRDADLEVAELAATVALETNASAVGDEFVAQLSAPPEGAPDRTRLLPLYIRALGAFKPPQAARQLSLLLLRPEREIQLAACKALAEMKDPGVIASLGTAADSQDAEVALAALAALANYGTSGGMRRGREASAGEGIRRRRAPAGVSSARARLREAGAVCRLAGECGVHARRLRRAGRARAGCAGGVEARAGQTRRAAPCRGGRASRSCRAIAGEPARRATSACPRSTGSYI